MRVGVAILPDTTWADNATRWRRTEELGFDSAWTYDHVWWRTLRDSPWFAAMPVLSAAAAVTSRLTIGVMVASPNFRNPVMTAKEAIAIDDISAGRFVLGVGAGAMTAGDATVLGGEPLSLADRADRFREFADLTDRLLRARETDYAGRFYTAREAVMVPGCVQAPRLPLAVAASAPRALGVAARYGDAWITPGPANWLGRYRPEECLAAVASQASELKRACDREGRDFASLDRIFLATGMGGNPLQSPDACLRTAESYAAIGMTHLILHWPRETGVYANDPRALEDVAAKVLPQIQAL
jgi:alkanesulfonate monooxygenase SsuD/methylene tetrahydromethanopterin reductase-like flavin-dependent oxidoreductase (luciferase family)